MKTELITVDPDPLSTASPAEYDESDSNSEGEDLKEVFHPEFEQLPGETSLAFQLRYAFVCSGYRVKKIEEFKAHPVVAIHAVRETAPRITDYKLFFTHVREILKSAGFRLRKDELTVDQLSGARIMIAFQTGKFSVDVDAILREARDDLVDEGPVPLLPPP